MRTIGFPRRYIQGAGALADLANVIVEQNCNRPFCVVDSVAGVILLPTVMASLDAADFDACYVKSPAECTLSSIEALTLNGRDHDADIIVALGGGKTIDMAKGVATRLTLPIVICPTIASSDAPTSRLTVVYDEAHRVVGVELMPNNPDIVLVDTQVIANAPPRFFAAGIGDALSKRFEARQCAAANGLNGFGTPAPRIAQLLADAAYDTLLRHGTAAYLAVIDNQVTDDVEAVVEATVLLSGLGFESGGLSLAHALIRGLTTIPELAGKLHGELVAYGTIVQLCFEDQPPAVFTEVFELIDAVGLPSTLADLGRAYPLTPQELDLLADATLLARYSVNTAPPVTRDSLIAAIKRAESLGRLRAAERLIA